MTATITEIAPSHSGSDTDSLNHVVCYCRPTNVDGDLLAMCGVAVEEPREGTSDKLECIVCAELEVTPGACRSCKE